jgi:hypothetical protein
MTLRQRIEQRITDLRVERDIAAAATPGPWPIQPGPDPQGGYFPDLWMVGVNDDGDLVTDWCSKADATHIATQDPATTIARIDRELAGCAADLALLDNWLGMKITPTVESLTLEGLVRAVIANIEARYPLEESS